MSRMIEVSEDVYIRIEALASAAGITMTEWVERLVPKPHRVIGGKENPQTLADEFNGRVGMVSSERGDLSTRVKELYGKSIMEKRRTGTL